MNIDEAKALAEAAHGGAVLEKRRIRTPMNYLDHDFDEGDIVFAPQELIDNWERAGIL